MEITNKALSEKNFCLLFKSYPHNSLPFSHLISCSSYTSSLSLLVLFLILINSFPSLTLHILFFTSPSLSLHKYPVPHIPFLSIILPFPSPHTNLLFFTFPAFPNTDL